MVDYNNKRGDKMLTLLLLIFIIIFMGLDEIRLQRIESTLKEIKEKIEKSKD